MTSELPLDGSQLEIQFEGSPWNAISPRYLCKCNLIDILGKPRGKEAISPEVVTDPQQLQLLLEGGSGGS